MSQPWTTLDSLGVSVQQYDKNADQGQGNDGNCLRCGLKIQHAYFWAAHTVRGFMIPAELVEDYPAEGSEVPSKYAALVEAYGPRRGMSTTIQLATFASIICELHRIVEGGITIEHQITPITGSDGYVAIAIKLGYRPIRIYAYGNLALLRSRRAYVPASLGTPLATSQTLDQIETETERLVLDSYTIVTGVATPAHQRCAVVPLRWGSPRILVLSYGIRKALGPDLNQEPFRAARLWRYQFDPTTDLALSLAKDDSGFMAHDPRTDRLIKAVAEAQL